MEARARELGEKQYAHIEITTPRGTVWRGIVESIHSDYLILRQARGPDNRPGLAKIYTDGAVIREA